jgi:hypothetical protein
VGGSIEGFTQLKEYCKKTYVTNGPIAIIVPFDCIYIRLFQIYLTLYNKIFPGYQPRQMVKIRKHRRFKGHHCPRPQGSEVNIVVLTIDLPI